MPVGHIEAGQTEDNLGVAGRQSSFSVILIGHFHFFHLFLEGAKEFLVIS